MKIWIVLAGIGPGCGQPSNDVLGYFIGSNLDCVVPTEHHLNCEAFLNNTVRLIESLTELQEF